MTTFVASQGVPTRRRSGACLGALCAVAVAGCASDTGPSPADAIAQREAELIVELNARERRRRAELREPAEIETAEWRALARRDPAGADEICTIVSGSRVVELGAMDAVARLVLTAHGLYFEGGAPLDPAAPESGIAVDGGIPRRFETLANVATVRAPFDADGLVERLSNGDVVIARAGYEARDHPPRVHELVFDLEDFDAALERYRACAAD